MSTANRITASFKEAKKRKTGLRCQVGREVVEVGMGSGGHFPREVDLVQRLSGLDMMCWVFRRAAALLVVAMGGRLATAREAKAASRLRLIALRHRFNNALGIAFHP